MTDPAAAPNPVPPRPPPVGRIPYYILLGVFLLALAVAGFYIATDSDAIPIGFVFVGFAGLLLVALPPVQFLSYFWRRQPPAVPPSTRRSIYASSGALIVIGGFYAWASLGTDEPALGAAAIGLAGALLGIAAIVLLLRFTRRPAGVPSDRQLVYTRFNGVGLVFFLIAVIVVPKFACGCGEDSRKAAVKSDLRNLVMAEEAFFADSTRYGYNRDLGANYAATTGDSIVVQFASDKGFHAIGWHPYLPDTRCGVWVGVAPPDGMHGAPESEPRCWTQK